MDGSPGRFGLSVDQGWCALHVFGGMTTAIAAAAARRCLDRVDLDMVSAQLTYVAPVSAGPVLADTEVVRAGRRGAQVRVEVGSSGDPAGAHSPGVLAHVVFGAPGDGPLLSNVGFPEDAGTPDGAVPRSTLPRPPIDVPVFDQSDYCLAPGSLPVERGDQSDPPASRSVSWFRFKRSPIGADGAWDPAALAVPADDLGPAIGRGTGIAGQFYVVTLQLSMQWFAPSRTEWVCQHANVVSARGGFVTGTTELWSEDRDLVALATQTALLRPLTAPG